MALLFSVEVQEFQINVTGLRLATLLCLGALVLPAQELREYERKVTEFTLANGLHFIILERHQAPVVSFSTHVDAGSARDPAGQSGMAHMLERLAFKGTETVGTRNWPAEKKALDDQDADYDRLEQERNKGPRADAGRIGAIEAEAASASNLARVQQNPDEFMRAFKENGAVGVSCHTTPDAIETSYSLPSNRVELWFLLESQRLAHPVFRDFYNERDNLQFELSNTVDAKPVATLQQTLLANAFQALPYRNPPLGWPSDVVNLRRADAKAFFDTYFVPGNIVIAIVGDVDPVSARQLAERYFGPLPAKPLPPILHTEEPPQHGPKSVTLWSNGPPLLMIGYKRPPETHRDDAALDAIGVILGAGRTSWMYKDMVEERRIAQGTEAISSFPASRYASLFLFSVIPASGHTVEENGKALDELLARFESKPVDAETLTRAKNLIRSKVMRVLGNNQLLASLLPSYYVNYGDWRRLFTGTSQYDQLTAEDLQRVALLYFTPSSRTTAYITPAPRAGARSSSPGDPQ
jgi:predicted Zn-dependent peptidase